MLQLEGVERLESFTEFEALLARPAPWIGGFDFPFSLPQQLVRDLGWPSGWPALVGHCARMTRRELRSALDAYRATRPVGAKYVHRATDFPAGSSSPMKLVNPPVALMFHEGAPRLLAAGVHVPALRASEDGRAALEAYPGLLVRKHLGIRESYKSDTRAEQTTARAAVRRRILTALTEGRPLGIRLSADWRVLAHDATGDTLDAAICAVQAAWAAGQPGYGLPEDVPEGEGWIVTS